MVDWTKSVISHCTEKNEPDIVFAYFEIIDAINHCFRNAYEKVDILYDGEHEIAVDATEQVYRFADELLGYLMDNFVGENTTIAVVSDHGAVGMNEEFNVWEIMEKAGLMHFDPNDQRRLWNNPYINWSKTKAYPAGPGYVNVNLKGREPCGIVEESDYDATVTEIIRALYTYGFSKDGKVPAVAFAVHKDQAGFIGHGGQDCPDVIFGLAGGRVGGVSEIHEEQIPSARSKTGNIRALCIISGPEFKENAVLNRPADLTDLAPTLCYALNYPQPKDATGGVVFQAYKEK